MNKPLTFQDAAEITMGAHIARAEQGARTWAAHHAAEAARCGGVNWSGLGSPIRYERTSAELIAEGIAAYEKVQAFGANPRGRFLMAIRALESAGWALEADSARAAMSRGFARPDQAACPVEVQRAIDWLADIDHPEARVARAALAELLCAASAMAAE